MAVASPVKEYISRSQSYLQDAENSLQEGWVEIASQCLQRSLEEALKAVAASRGLNLRSDLNIWNYASALAESMGDDSLFAITLPAARFVYVDSYGYSLTPEEWQLFHGSIAAGVRELLDMATRGSRR